MTASTAIAATTAATVAAASTATSPTSRSVGLEPIDHPAGSGRPDRQRRAGRIAGLGYISIFLLAIFANFLVVEAMVVPDDAAATTANIQNDLTIFRWGLVAFLAVFVIDIVLAWAMHMVFRTVDHDVSLLAAWSRLTYTVFLGIGLVFFFQVIHLVADGGGSGPDQAQLEADVLAAMNAFDATWMIGLAAFGLHLVLVGWLILSGRVAPRALGVVLVVAGVAYVIDTIVLAVMPDRAPIEGLLLAMVAIPSVIGEGWLGLWLLLRAGRSTTSTGSNTGALPPGSRQGATIV